MRRRTALGIALAGAAGAAGIGAALRKWSADDSLDRLLAAGTVRVGFAVEPPYATVGAHGEVSGLAPELARRVLRRLGLPEPQWVQVSFDELIPQLQARRFDVIAAGMFITRERAALVRFSEPCERVAPGVLVAAGNPRGLGRLSAAVAAGGPSLAVLSGSVEAQALKGLGLPADRMRTVSDAAAGAVAVRAGVVDGLLLSLPSVRRLAAADAGLQAQGWLSEPDGRVLLPVGHTAFEFHRDDVQLQQAWDLALRESLGSAAHLALLWRHGFLPEDVAHDVSRASLLGA